MKVHAKLCLIKKRVNNKTIQYGFVSTGNLNERTAKIYADHCLLTANRSITADMNRIFNYLELPNRARFEQLRQCKQLIPCPVGLRNELGRMIQKEIKSAQAKKEARIIIKTNSLSDYALINKLYEAAQAGVEIKLIVRGICCMLTENKKFKKPVQAISIVDEYLEHARIFVFHNDGDEKVFISSADWMVRNLDHRVEATCPILSKKIRSEIKDILQIQLSDNNKARILNNELTNQYVKTGSKRKVRSQVEIYNYLFKKLSTKPGE
jgi:polyphosphate kinase